MRGGIARGVAVVTLILGGAANADESSAAAVIKQLYQKIQESQQAGYVCQSIGTNAAANFDEIYGLFMQGQQLQRRGYGGEAYFGTAEYQASAYLSQFRSAGC